MKKLTLRAANKILADKEKIVIDPVKDTVTLNFVRGAYEINLGCIKTERDMLGWTLHLSGKYWMTAPRLNCFIRAVGEYKKFKIYGRG